MVISPSQYISNFSLLFLVLSKPVYRENLTINKIREFQFKFKMVSTFLLLNSLGIEHLVVKHNLNNIILLSRMSL